MPPLLLPEGPPRSVVRRPYLLGFVVILACVVIIRSANAQGCTESGPREAVLSLWNMAVRGQLLTPRGWQAAARLFAKPSPFPDRKSVVVYSNYYSIYSVSVAGDTAYVDVRMAEQGEIDSTLRYTPPPKLASSVYETALRYHLVASPPRLTMYGPDGKTKLSEKTVAGEKQWKIEDPQEWPWTTVNTAIRYVLERRNETKDVTLRRNADATLSKLMMLR